MNEIDRGAELWDRIWSKNQITSDYSIRYLDFYARDRAESPGTFNGV